MYRMVLFSCTLNLVITRKFNRCNKASDIIKNASFLQRFQFMVIGAVQILKWFHKSCHIFEKISARVNNGSSNFQVTSTKLPYFCAQCSLVIIQAVQILKKLHYILGIWVGDNRGSSNFQMISLKVSFLGENFSSW